MLAYTKHPTNTVLAALSAPAVKSWNYGVNTMSKLYILVTMIAVIALLSCGDQGKPAKLEGWTVDLVSQSETLGPDGHKDVQIDVPVDPGPAISRIQVRNVDGTASNWDTIPNNVCWAIGVADRRKPQALLNRQDGSVQIPVKEQSELLLYLQDNGAFRGGGTQFEVLVTREGGQETSYRVER